LHPQNSVAADTLLYFCKRLWGLPYLAPTFALLLHRCGAVGTEQALGSGGSNGSSSSSSGGRLAGSCNMRRGNACSGVIV
jgi:hypothetical protein